MSSGGLSKGSWIQCTTCGEIHNSRSVYPIEELYVEDHCPNCDADIGLNLGEDKDKLYELYNISLDARYFIY